VLQFVTTYAYERFLVSLLLRTVVHWFCFLTKIRFRFWLPMRSTVTLKIEKKNLILITGERLQFVDMKSNISRSHNKLEHSFWDLLWYKISCSSP
jgi:hypothetical protein